MKKSIIFAGVMLLSAPALANGGGSPVYNQTFDESVTQKTTIWQRLTNKQAQRQQQAQGQSQQAYGGNANASNSGVRVDGRATTVVAPSISGNGDTRAFSIGSPWFALGLSNPTEVYRLGQIGTYLMQFRENRPALYTMCGVRDAHVGLMLMGVRCDLARAGRFAEVDAWEVHVQQITKPRPVSHKQRRKARKVSKPIPMPTARPVKEACSCKPEGGL